MIKLGLLLCASRAADKVWQNRTPLSFKTNEAAGSVVPSVNPLPPSDSDEDSGFAPFLLSNDEHVSPSSKKITEDPVSEVLFNRSPISERFAKLRKSFQILIDKLKEY